MLPYCDGEYWRILKTHYLLHSYPEIM